MWDVVWVVWSHTMWELTTGTNFHLCLHWLLTSTGRKSSHSDFLDVSRSNGRLRISGWIGQLSWLAMWMSNSTFHCLPAVNWMCVKAVIVFRRLSTCLCVHVCLCVSTNQKVVLETGYVDISYSTQVVASHGRCFYVCLVVVARWRCNHSRCRREIFQMCSWDQKCRLITMMGVVLGADYLFCLVLSHKISLAWQRCNCWTCSMMAVVRQSHMDHICSAFLIVFHKPENGASFVSYV